MKRSKLNILAIVTILLCLFVVKDNIYTTMYTFRGDSSKGDSQDSSVLGTSTTGSVVASSTFEVNIPTIFNDTVTFAKDIVIPNIIKTVTGGSGIKVSSSTGNITVTNTGVTSINGSAGAISLTAGSGISIDGLTITNNDKGSDQSIFKNIAVDGQNTITAGGNSSTLTFASNGGISITTDSTNQKIIFTASGNSLNISGWLDAGLKVYNSTLTDLVGIGTSTPSAKLDVAGTENTTGKVTLDSSLQISGSANLLGNLQIGGNATFGSNSSNLVTFFAHLADGTTLAPETDLGADLGTENARFNNLFAAHLNSESGLTTSGQATFTYSPSDISFAQSTLFINSGSSVANGTLLGLGVAGYQKAGIDAEGDLVLGYSGNVSTPITQNTLAIYNHGTTLVASADTSGNLTTAGNIDIAGDADFAGTLSLSTLTSTGDLTLSSASGSNINVELSDGSQFTVDGTNLVVDGTTGNVGIGTSTPIAALDVEVAKNSDGIVLTNSSTKVLGLSIADNSGIINVLPSTQTNTITNGSFDTDLTGWSGTPRYTLDDEFSDTLPETLATSSAVTLQSGGISNPTPILGSELVTNGNMETGNPPTRWSAIGSATLTSVADERTGGTGTQSLNVIKGTDNYSVNQNFTPSNNTWYTFSGWGKNISGSSNYNIALTGGGTFIYLSSFASSWNSYVASGRQGTSGTITVYGYTTGSARFDDVSLKPLTLSSLFSTTDISTSSYSDYSVQADVTLTSKTQAGVVLNLDSQSSPSNFVIAYTDGTYAYLEKNVAGTYTQLIKSSISYAAGRTIKVVKQGTNYSLYYNGTKIGTTQTISDTGIINNTYQGVFSTYASNSFSNFLVQGQVMNPVPVVGSELVTNGGFDSDTGWTKGLGWTIDGVTANHASSAGGDSLSQNILTIGNWYQSTYTITATNGGYVISRYGNTNLNIGPLRTTTGTFTDTQRAATSTAFGLYAFYTNVGSVDNISLKSLTLSSLFSTVTVASSTDHTVQSDVTMTAGTQAGVVLNLDSASSPTKFVIAYTDGSKVYLEKNVSGTYTTVISGTAITYVAGATLKVIQNGTSYSVFYNGTQVGSTVTISDVPVTNIQGQFSTYAGNSFANFSVKGGINGTLATDGNSTRTVQDTLGYATVGSGYLNFSNGKSSYTNPALWEGTAISRTAGKVLVGSINIPSNSTTSRIGLSTSVTGGVSEGLNINYNNLTFISSGGAINTGVGAMSYSTPTPIAIILRSTGSYLFAKLNGTWTFLFKSDLGSSSSYYAYVNNHSMTNPQTDYLRVPTSTFLPTPLAYDTFTSTGSATTETTGPDGQTTPALSWTGGTKSEGKMNITPTMGNEIAPDNNAASTVTEADATTGWTSTTATLSSVTDNRTGSTGTKSLNILASANNAYARMSTTSISTGNWFFVSSWYKNDSGNYAAIYDESIPLSIFPGYVHGETTWTNKIFSYRQGSSSNYGLRFYSVNNGYNTRWDDISVKQLTLSSLFASVSTSTPAVVASADITLTAGTQAGLVTNLDSASSPANFLIAYHDGTNVHLDKNVGGTYTSLINTSATYVAGATLRVTTDNSTSGSLKVRVYYNNALIGSEQTITDSSIINNTKHGLFSTYSGNTFDNFALFARGTNGEYSNIALEPLTVTRDTSIKYDDSTASAKLVAGDTDGDFTGLINVGNTSTYTLSAYAYTDGSAVTSSDLQLYYGSSPVTTNYYAVGTSGWYKLTGIFTGIADSEPIGVRVKAGKTVYVDNISTSLSSEADTTLYITNSGTGMAGLNVQTTTTLHSGVSDNQALIIKGTAGQSANLSEWKDYYGNILAYVSPTGIFNAVKGAATFVKAGTISDYDFTDPVDGMIAIDSTDERIYFRSNGAWSYVAKTGGFQIPASEAQGLNPGEYLIPYVESIMNDGAVHGLYKKFDNTIAEKLFAPLEARIETLENATESSSINPQSQLSILNVLGISTFNDASASASLTAGLVTIDSKGINAIGTLSINPSASFNNDAVEIDASGNLKLNSGVIFGNDDFRGSEILPAESTEITVSKDWNSIPFSVAAKARFQTNTWVTDISKNGFVIHTSSESASDENIDWEAIW